MFYIFAERAHCFVVETELPSLLWKDDVSEGVVGDLDLRPLHEILREDEVLTAGTRLHQILADGRRPVSGG